jgi:isoleucyl-tRNA synthetase
MSDDKISGYETLFHVLLTFSKILAPVCPFFAEELFKNLTGGESVHLEMMPFSNEKLIDNKLNKKIEISREIVRLAAFIRGNKKIKLRQPLAKLQFAIETSEDVSLSIEDLAVIKSEANVHEVEIISREILEKYAKRIVKVQAKKVGPRLGKKVQELIIKGKQGKFEALKNDEIKISDEILTTGEYEFGFLTQDGVEAEATSEVVVLLDTEITEDLKIEGFSREIIRSIQDLRKTSGFEIADRIKVEYSTDSELLKNAFGKFREKIAGETLATEIIEKSNLNSDEMEIGGEKCVLRLVKS